MAKRPTGDELERLRRHFEIERELADRLRRSTREERPRLYAELYAELFRRVELPGNADAQRAQVGLLLRLLEPLLDGRRTFLEFGAGTGELSLELARRLERVWAVDAVDPGIDPGSAPEGFTFVEAGEVAGAIPAGAVDLALSCHFVEHLHPDDLQDHLGLLLSRLTPGGVYVVVTPNRLYGPHDVSRHFSYTPRGLHLREYSHLELGRELATAGFAPVAVLGRLGEAPDPRGWWRVGVAERLLDALPARLRRWGLDRAPRQAPFRPLEQVKVAGFKPRRGSRR
ncbi:MAG: class I SAM-dependent methyltransferase [Thermoanaerobaculales bacterium]|jgi:SAM-dependent methyltransferase|nr:class I SAM-dependent methyltransferase [Thermoanaerobaculales bacterium]